MARNNKQTKSQNKSKKPPQKVSTGLAHIDASFNNTKVVLTSLNGDVLGWSSAGAQGFKGSKKATPHAASVAAKVVAESVFGNNGLRSVAVRVRGPGPGRESAVRALSEFFKVVEIVDITPIPHNGCRAEKERRV